jgi:hypothetical protein
MKTTILRVPFGGLALGFRPIDLSQVGPRYLTGPQSVTSERTSGSLKRLPLPGRR